MIVETIHALSSLQVETQTAFREIVNDRQVKKGEHLVRIGQRPKLFYYVVKGLARVYYLRKEKEVTDYFAIDNQFIGALPALFTKQPSHKAIQVLEDTHIEYFDYEQFENLCARAHDLERAARKITSMGMLQGQQRIESIRFFSAKERYEELERLYPGITNRAPLKDIASYLGTTQVSISRIRAGKQ